MQQTALSPHFSAAVAVAAAHALATRGSAEAPPAYDTVVARVPALAKIRNIYPDRNFDALRVDDTRWKLHPPTGVLPPKVLQELKKTIGDLPHASTDADEPRKLLAPQPTAPPLTSIGAGAVSTHAPQKPGDAEKTAKRLQRTNEQQTLELLKKKRKLEEDLRRLEVDLHQARQAIRRAP